MVQEKQLRELFKYIEANWDVCVSQVDKTDIKRIFGGVLCKDIMNEPDQVTDQEPDQVAEPTEQVDEQFVKCICTNSLQVENCIRNCGHGEEPEQETLEPELNPIEQAYERGEKIRHKDWLNGDWIQKHKETKTIDNHGNINSVYPFAFIQHPEKWELYTEPTEQPALEMCESDAIDYILTNKLNWKKLGDNRMFAIGFGRTGASFRVSFVEYHHTLSGTREVIINNIDLSEWQPVDTSIKHTEQPAKPFDKDRFERMFCAVVASGVEWEYDNIFGWITDAIKKLDAYYASKEGGDNE